LALPRAIGAADAPPKVDAGPPVKPGPNGTVVHFGDSFLDAGLRQYLGPRFATDKTRYFFFGRRMSGLAQWAYSDQIRDLYYGYRPALFLVTLAANDLMFPQPDQRAFLVHRIVAEMRGAPCVWISIPLWKSAPTGFVDMIRRSCAPCRHFDSSVVASKITRQPDGRHPDEKGGVIWAEAFWNWLQAERDPSRGYWALKPAPPEEHGPRPAASASPPGAADAGPR
jgi:hypothetical protein